MDPFAPSDPFAPPPEELLPPPQAWAMRLVFLGVALLMLSVVVNGARDFPGRIFAEKMVATGDIHVMDTSDERAEAAFARAIEGQPVEAGMTFMKSDRQSRSFQAWVTGPNRDAALAQMEALLLRFQREFGGTFGNEVTTFNNAWVPPMQTPKVRAWGRGMRLACKAMIVVGVISFAGGVRLLWIATKGDNKEFANVLFGDRDEPGIEPQVYDEDDEDDEPPKPNPPASPVAPGS